MLRCYKPHNAACGHWAVMSIIELEERGIDGVRSRPRQKIILLHLCLSRLQYQGGFFDPSFPLPIPQCQD